MKLDARRFVLPNGVVLLVVPRPEAPLVAVRALVEGGPRRETKPGTAWLAARTLAAGAGDRSELELADAVESRGGVLHTTSVGVGLKTLAEDLPFALDTGADLLRRPRFEDAAFERERGIAVAEAAAERDIVRVRAFRAFLRAVYGDHPAGRDPKGDPARVTRDDVVAYHRRCFVPARAIVAVVGAVDPEDAYAHAARAFGGWNAPAQPLPPVPPPPAAPGGEILLPADREQVHVYCGHLGIPRVHPDYLALHVLDHVLGTGPGFTDRLSRRIRDELGLAYAVNAEICGTAGEDPGAFRAYVATAPDAWRRAHAEIVAAVRAMRDAPVGADELEAAKTYLSSAYVFEFQTAEDVAGILTALEYFGLGLDYPARHLAGIAAVTAGDVRAAAGRHLRPDRLVTVAAGPKGALQRASERLS